MRTPARGDKSPTRAQPVSLAPLSTETALATLLQIPASKLKDEPAQKPKRKTAGGKMTKHRGKNNGGKRT
jgi:hypothetical protein